MVWANPSRETSCMNAVDTNVFEDLDAGTDYDGLHVVNPFA
jgi:hypothetical protein